VTRQLRLRAARRKLDELASRRGGVLYRPEIVRAGVPRWVVRLEIRMGRWQPSGRQTVVTHNGPLSRSQQLAVAVLEVGPRAALDGVSRLQHLGIDVKDDGAIHVLAPKSSTPGHPKGVRVHESRRYDESDVVIEGGLRVVRAPVAAVHAALWARTAKEATLLALLVVQQRKASAQEFAVAVEAVRKHPFRRLLRDLAGDLRDGARSLGEIDVARAMRARGLPEPDRQVVRHRATGTAYLDVHFKDYALTLEVDGVQHDEPASRVADVLRDLAGLAEGDGVIRLPLVAWRVSQEDILDALEAVFASRGWRRDRAA
jgi:very-short-patch-repair endonuclease